LGALKSFGIKVGKGALTALDYSLGPAAAERLGLQAQFFAGAIADPFSFGEKLAADPKIFYDTDRLINAEYKAQTGRKLPEDRVERDTKLVQHFGDRNAVNRFLLNAGVMPSTYFGLGAPGIAAKAVSGTTRGLKFFGASEKVIKAATTTVKAAILPEDVILKGALKGTSLATKAATGLTEAAGRAIWSSRLGSGVTSLAKRTENVRDIFGIKPITPFLSRRDRYMNILKSTLKQAEENAFVKPAIEFRKVMKRTVASQAAAVGAKVDDIIRGAFDLDDAGRIRDLVDLVPGVPGAPTVADVAARFPRLLEVLSTKRKAALREVEQLMAPYTHESKRMNVTFEVRHDILDGGFYMTRGAPELPKDPLLKRLRVGGEKSYERPAPLPSQASGLEAGYVYPNIADATNNYIRDVGAKVFDDHIANYFKTIRGVDDNLLGEITTVRMLRDNPRLSSQMDAFGVAVSRLRNLNVRLGDRVEGVLDQFLNDPLFDNIDSVITDIRAVKLKTLWADIVSAKKVKGGPSKGATQSEVQAAFEEVKSQIEALQPEYNSALLAARSTPKGESVIPFPHLAGRSFPQEIAAAAIRGLADEVPKRNIDAVISAFNNTYRGLRATGDNSALGIQGLLGMANDQRAYGAALKTNLRAWTKNGEQALGKHFNKFDKTALGEGRLTTREWAKYTLQIGGKQTEFRAGVLELIPGIRRANRAFGYFGDALRVEWADDELKLLMAKSPGKSIDDLIASGEVESIAKVINGATGYSSKVFGGAAGDLVFFAPRFIQSRLETLTRASTSLIPGVTTTLEQRLARRYMMKLIGIGTLLTVMVNERESLYGGAAGFATGDTERMKKATAKFWPPVTDFEPTSSNFMRIRLAGRDYSVFGTWDSIVKAIIWSAMGKPQDAVRGMGSGIQSVAWDFITGENFIGERTRDSAGQLTKSIAQMFTPFAAEEIPRAVGDIATGDPSDITTGVVTIFGEAGGIKSSPMTTFEELDEIFQKEKDINPDGKPFRKATVEQKRIFEERYPEKHEQLRAGGRGPVGEAIIEGRVIEAARDTRIAAISGVYGPRMQQGNGKASDQFREEVGDALSDASAARLKANGLIGAFQEPKDLSKIDDVNDRALAQFYQWLNSTIEDGGVRGPTGVDSLLLEEKIRNEPWTDVQREYVEDQSGVQRLKGLGKEYMDFNRSLDKREWSRLYTRAKFFNDLAPYIQKVYREYDDAGRIGIQQEYLSQQKRPGDLLEIFTWIDTMTKNVKILIRAQDPDLDFNLIRFYGASPTRLESQVKMARALPKDRRVEALFTTPGNSIERSDIARLMQAGFTLEKIAASSAEQIADVIPRRTSEAISQWDLSGQARRILEALR
jgi:chorismate mutase